MQAFVDPLRADAEGRVRFDAMTGIGDEAIAVVERQDKTNGIMPDAALIVIRRGTWPVSVLAPQLAQRERADAFTPGTLASRAAHRTPQFM